MPEPTQPTPTSGATDPNAAQPAAAAEAAVDAKALQAEIDRLKAESAEKDTAVRYWHEAATKGAKKDAPAADPKNTEETDEDPIEVLSKEGAKGLDKLLEKRGFVRKADVDTAVNQKAALIATENELAASYPDLKDPKSEFFKETAKHYQQLKAEGVPEAAAMKLAARQAELEGYKSGKRLTPAEKEEREARARAQGGGKEKPAAAAHKDDDDDKLDAEQERICNLMGISKEAYQKRAKAGVVVGSK